MKNKLLVICGPTATGKTSLALHLAKKYNGELISADSRQVYKGMDIGTGKDLPEHGLFYPVSFSRSRESMKVHTKTRMTEEIGYYVFGGIPVWGLDLVSPKEEFSISDFVRIGRTIISDIRKREKLPIVVGGTGFYIQGLLDGIATIDIPKDRDLRRALEKKTVDELCTLLKKYDEGKALSLNASDRKNPARLIRAIEVAQFKKQKRIQKTQSKLDVDTLYIGLTAQKHILHKRIEKRVEERIVQGIEEEIKKLIEVGVSWDMQSMQTLSYKEWRRYFEGKDTKESSIQEWVRDEKRYAKRQMTWFKKDNRILWFDVDDPLYMQSVENKVKTWHT